jgi:hypothetical protein
VLEVLEVQLLRHLLHVQLLLRHLLLVHLRRLEMAHVSNIRHV